jgi:hypothetical protein
MDARSTLAEAAPEALVSVSVPGVAAGAVAWVSDWAFNRVFELGI